MVVEATEESMTGVVEAAAAAAAAGMGARACPFCRVGL